jgi:hypothetical protein
MDAGRHPGEVFVRHRLDYGPNLAAGCVLPTVISEAGTFFYVVAVGTTIADRPPHRSVRARLRIKCVPSHFMQYVASRIMCRPAFTTVKISEPVHLDTT